jgi:hypothetical protein
MSITLSLATKLFFFGFTLWLGAYLLARNSSKATVRLTGLGLISYACVLVVEILFERIIPALALLPALFWIGAALHLTPEETRQREILIRVWVFAAIPVFILTLVNTWIAAIVIVALLACAGMVARLAMRAYFRNTFAVIAVVAMFFALSTGLMVLPVRFISSFLGIFLLGLDLLFLGLVIVVWDAFDEGENIRLPLLRSFVSAFYYAGALAALVILAAAIEGNLGFGKLLLLTSLIAFGILTQTFSTNIQKLLDLAAFPRATEMNQQREMLYQTADEMPRLSALDPLSLPEDEFICLTRRAISSLGDLPRLSISPLVYLPQVQGTQNPLERAQKLKTLLVEHIQRLKPQQSTGFGSTDEWRYYNALHFPYVAGLKPYTRRQDKDYLDEVSRQALNWFQTSVPERTLHNWQNIAAQLVAKSLRNSP